MSDITDSEVDRWLRALTVSSTTRNNTRRVLVVAFNFAVERAYCLNNPALKAAMAKEVESSVGILTVKQTISLLEAATPDVLPFIAIGAFAGLRTAEIERLDWREIDLEAGLIEVKASNAKTAQRRFVKIQENLASWLLLPQVKREGRVIPMNCRSILLTVRESAKIIDWPPNALRHGFASYHLAHFNNASALAHEMGHSNSNLIYQHYRQVVKPKEAALYWKIAPDETKKKLIAFVARA